METAMNVIDRDTLKAKLQTAKPPVLAEALPEKYWRDWRLPGARHLPHDAVDSAAARALPDKSAEIVVPCASRTCQNSHIAARRLEQLGYTNVAVYPGGKQDWSEAGLPVEREPIPA
jgi:rhodanese-related sulfurtransferase